MPMGMRAEGESEELRLRSTAAINLFADFERSSAAGGNFHFRRRTRARMSEVGLMVTASSSSGSSSDSSVKVSF